MLNSGELMRFVIPNCDTCSFCQDLSGSRECAFIVKNEHAAAMVNERQYEHGAALVIPRSHRESIFDITDAEIAAVYSLVKQIAQATTKAFGAVGVNVFQNNGVRAGQSEAHFHVHVVPRYPGSNQADVDRLASLYDEHAVNHQVPEQPVVGRAAIRSMFEREFATAEMVCIPEHIFHEGEWAILEWRDPLGLRGCGFFTCVMAGSFFSAGTGTSSAFCGSTGCRSRMLSSSR
jgi:diadenosine tetraphosphate (Ap4A) HIT family hydrolase